MKKHFIPLLFLLFLCFSSFAALAQSAETITLTWQGTAAVEKTGNKPATIPVFTDALVDFKARLPYYTLKISNAEVAAFELQNPVYVAFTSEEARSFPKDKLKATPAISIRTGVGNGKKVSTISFAPIRLNPLTGQTEKLTSFAYTYTTAPNSFKQGNNLNTNNNKRTYAQNSVLTSGSWFKIGVTETGIYKIDFATLQALGINPQNINPKNLQLYGNGGGMLPQANAAPRADDLVQNAILVEGENDGVFQNSDYLLFYGQGPHTWEVNKTKTGFTHTFNVYSDTTYYFITVGQNAGLRVTNSNFSGTSAGATITTFNEHLFHELDKVNLLTSGREWYGEEFNAYALSKEITFPVSDLDPNSSIALTASVLGSSPVSYQTVGGRFTIKANNVNLGVLSTVGHGGGDYHFAGDADSATFSQPLNTLSYNNSDLKIGVYFDQMGLSTSLGYLNYLELNAKRRLNLFDNQTSFRSLQNIGPTAVSQFRIGNVFTNIGTYVWEVTNPRKPVNQNAILANNEATFYAKTDSVREYVIFSGTNFPAPVAFGQVANQNLHSLNRNGKLDLLIVTHPGFYSQALRLANHRRQHDKLNVDIVTTTQVYNEFSSGAQDVTAIRDLMKMIYDRKIQNGTKTADSVIYLLLLGDASYDYKSKFADSKLNRTQSNTNFVPVYESRESLQPLETYSSEDYFGLLDDNEGTWSENNFGTTDLVDIGIGRLVAHNSTDADVMVNKIIAYDNADHFGKWRNRITLVTDDEQPEYQNSAEIISNAIEAKHPDFNVHKIYLDMYKQDAAPNGQRSPDCVAAIDQAVEQGSLLLNYIGHGGETGLAHEQIVTVGQINSWNNFNNPAFMITATCEFGRYDDPRRNSAAEWTMLNPNGGSIGLVTTTRPVYSNYNDDINKSLSDQILTRINGRLPRIGDIIQIAKYNTGASTYQYVRNFTLLCDPSMRLAYPEESVKVTSVQLNGTQVVTDTLKALSTVKINGQVTDRNQNVLSGFNGKVNVTVYEKKTLVRTLGDKDGTPNVYNPPTDIPTRENIIYEGVATAKNGLFSSTFVVPKDINYNYGFGKVSLYAASGDKDAHGSKTDIVIGGSANNVAADTIPPVIRLYMDNESFVYGGLTGNNSLLISHLSDSSGINTAGLGIGHEITATLDGNKENVKVLNEFYTSDLDNFRSGKVRYMFKNLTPGPHELRVKAWDTHNNSSEKRIEFIVANSEGLALSHVLNYPNPFSTNTTFHFDQNRAGEDLDIQIQIFTVSGKLVKTLNATAFASKPHVSEINWNGRDDYNDLLAKGVYVYKLTVRAGGGSKVSKYEKLVILN